MSEVLFHIVTDDRELALADILASAPSNAPRWAKVTSDPVEILAIPDGAKVHHGVWYRDRDTTAAELAWRERRIRGGLIFLTDEEMRKVSHWRARHAGRAFVDPEPAIAAAAPPPQANNEAISSRWK